MPILEHTSQPFLRGLRNLKSETYDWVLPPKVAQFRLDLRAIASRFAIVLGKRIPLYLIHGVAWITLGRLRVLLISAIMQLGLALPMAYYFHRATVIGLPANLLVIPLMEILMPAAVAAVAIGLFPYRGKNPSADRRSALQIITGTVHRLGALRVADTRVATPALATILFGCAALAIAMLLARRRAMFSATGLAMLSIAAFWIAAIPPKPQFNPE